MGFSVSEFLDEARHCPDLASLKCVLQKTMDRVGFSRWAYARKGEIDHTFPIAWVEHYVRQSYELIDPIITRGTLAHSPFRWSRIAEPSTLSRKELEYYREAIDYGLIDGIGIPLYGGSGKAMFSMASDCTVDEIDCLLARNMDQLIALGYAFHSIYNQLFHQKSKIDKFLSPREVECLLWASRGKTSWEIGCILNITARTVVFHIENCKRKLQARTRQQAIVEAIASGLIQP